MTSCRLGSADVKRTLGGLLEYVGPCGGRVDQVRVNGKIRVKSF